MGWIQVVVDKFDRLNIPLYVVHCFAVVGLGAHSLSVQVDGTLLFALLAYIGFEGVLILVIGLRGDKELVSLDRITSDRDRESSTDRLGSHKGH